MKTRFPSALTIINALLLFAVVGCASTKVVVIPAKPEPTGLTPVKQRLTDETRAHDEAWFATIEKQIEAQPKDATSRAAAEIWLRAAREEYALGSCDPFVDEAAQLAHDIAADPDFPATAVQAWQVWAAHRRETSGFHAALPLIRLADEAVWQEKDRRMIPTSVKDARPKGVPDRLFALQTRLAELHDQDGVPVDSYAWAKAQAWLDFALDEYFQRDRSGIVAEAMAQASKVADSVSVAAHNDFTLNFLAVATANPRLGGTANYQPDLWRRAEDLRAEMDSAQLLTRDPALSALARMEVQLIQAGFEHQQRGVRAARPYLNAANRLAREAESSGTKPKTTP